MQKTERRDKTWKERWRQKSIEMPNEIESTTSDGDVGNEYTLFILQLF